MKTLYLVTITAIGIASIVSISFLLMNLASHSGSVLDKVEQTHTQDYFQYKDINPNLARLASNPQNICFNADDSFLDRYPVLANTIDRIDKTVSEQNPNHIPTRGKNILFDTAVPYDKPEIIDLLSRYHFNDTSKVGTVPDGEFVFDYHELTCSFTHNGGFYELRLFYQDLLSANGNLGYVMVDIDNNTEHSTTAQSPKVVWVPFNSTLVFRNDLKFPVSIAVTSNSSNPDMVSKVDPNALVLFPLHPDWNKSDATLYHYEVNGIPQIQGDIQFRHVSSCINETMARSLYQQQKFQVKFPTYVPQGFSQACIMVETPSSFFAFYANQSAVSFHNSNSIYHRGLEAISNTYNPQAAKGLILLIGQIDFNTNTTETALISYHNMLNMTREYGNVSMAQNNGTVVTTAKLRNMWAVSSAQNHELYSVRAELPPNELERMADSLK